MVAFAFAFCIEFRRVAFFRIIAGGRGGVQTKEEIKEGMKAQLRRDIYM
jgi:hypothetical protein